VGVPDTEATIPAIRALLDLARQSGMKVVFTQDTHTEGDPEGEISNPSLTPFTGLLGQGFSGGHS
jgi:nicotinamidase-related amidase